MNNINRLKQMFDKEKREHLANVVNNAQSVDMKKTQQEKNESEEVTLESLGLTEADLNILAEAGNIFS